MTSAIGFDVYGTLVDPLEMEIHLKPIAGDQASRFAEIWRSKQLEYTFRRSLMGLYANFDTCTREALYYTAGALGVLMNDTEVGELLDAYLQLTAFPDVVPGLAELRGQGHQMVAFSNGVESTLRELLSRAGVLDYLDGVVSVDDVQTFKPSPSVYQHLAGSVGRPAGEVWLVSSNYWDVMGAKEAGLNAAWLQRSSTSLPDPWGTGPDITISSLEELPGQLATRGTG